MLAYLLVLGATLCFSIGSQFFTHFSKSFTPHFVNLAKNSIALVFFCLASFLFQQTSWDSKAFAWLFLSGFIGLNIGDIFLLSAFKEIGPGRTMVLFSFQPLIVGGLSFLFLGQGVELEKLIAIIFFIGCLICFSFENFKKTKSWGVRGLLFALIGMTLDGVGIVITRLGFEAAPEMHSWMGNTYRCLGAVVGFFIVNLFIRGLRQNPWNIFTSLKTNQKGWLLAGSLLGTFLSLSLYLHAIKIGHLATMAGLAITSPLLASAIEMIWKKEKPTKLFFLSFFFLIIGFSILMGWFPVLSLLSFGINS